MAEAAAKETEDAPAPRAAAARALEDDEVLELLGRVNGVLRLRAELAAALREGFVELSSARHSRAMASSAGICAANFPQEAEAWVRVAAVAAAGSRRAGFRLERAAEAAEQGVAGPVQAAFPGGLRHRGKGGEGGTGSEGGEPAPAGQGEAVSSEGDALLLRWLAVAPRGPLLKSQRAFERALELAVSLAERHAEVAPREDESCR